MSKPPVGHRVIDLLPNFRNRRFTGGTAHICITQAVYPQHLNVRHLGQVRHRLRYRRILHHRSHGGNQNRLPEVVIVHGTAIVGGGDFTIELERPARMDVKARALDWVNEIHEGLAVGGAERI